MIPSVRRPGAEQLDPLAIRLGDGPLVEEVDDVKIGQGAGGKLKRPEAGKVAVSTEYFWRRLGKEVRRLLEIEKQSAIPPGIAE